jgi:hypothetical protein
VLVLVVAVLATIGALVWTVRALLGRLGTLGADLDHLQRDLGPALDRVQHDADVTRVELAALGDRLDRWSDARRARRPRRWRPPR